MRLMRRLVRTAIVAAALWIAAHPLPAAAQTGSVSGTVVDEGGAPLANAEVLIVGTKLHGPSDDKGHFQIAGVAPGTWTVRALAMGFKPATASVTVTADAAAEVSLRLEKAPILQKPIEVVVGSRAHHTAADELAVPVDVYNSEVIARQGATETSQVLAALSPSVNFPHQSVTDATDIVRPFTLRGLSPDQTLVLVNGLRRHQTALVNTFAYGMPAGSSGVDMNAMPATAIDRIEVLRDGAAAQYGSDAIAGVVNVVTKRGRFAPSVVAHRRPAPFGRLSARRQELRRQRIVGAAAGPRLDHARRRGTSIASPPIARGPTRPRRRAPGSTTSSTPTPARSSPSATRCRSPITIGATGSRRTSSR